MSQALCPDCRRLAAAAARAAISVLADERADDSERAVAGDVAVEMIEVLCMPPGAEDAGW